jgi:hypothetical protein
MKKLQFTLIPLCISSLYVAGRASLFLLLLVAASFS